MQPMVNWIKHGENWQLYVGRGKRPRCVATVYRNGTWFTWDRNGTGGENSVNSNIEEAKIEAAGCAVRQGFI